MPSVRLAALVCMTLHYSLLTVFLHLSRTASPTPYKASAAVLLTELGKLLVSVFLASSELRDAAESSSARSPPPPSSSASFSSPPSHLRSHSLSNSVSFSTSSPTPRHTLPQHPPSPHYSIDMPSASSHKLPSVFSLLWAQTFGPSWWHLGLPAVLYTFQANLQYLASSNLSVPAFQITYQLKILTTALCSVFLLNRSLSRTQWLSLFLLTVGVAFVQLGSTPAAQGIAVHPPPQIPAAPVTVAAAAKLPWKAPSFAKDSDTLPSFRRPKLPSHVVEPPKHEMNQALGLAAVILACLSSGFASTYVERKLKFPSSNKNSNSNSSIALTTSLSSSTSSSTISSTSSSPPPSATLHSSTTSAASSATLVEPSTTLPNLWVQNIQLSIFGSLMAALVMVAETNKSAIFAFWSGLVSSPVPLIPSIIPTVSLSSFSASTFFQGFTPIVYFVVFLQIIGGLIAALVIKHADNIEKGFATSLSIIISFLASVILFEFSLNFRVLVGSSFVLFSTWLYSYKPRPNPNSNLYTPHLHPHSPSSSSPIMSHWIPNRLGILASSLTSSSSSS